MSLSDWPVDNKTAKRLDSIFTNLSHAYIFAGDSGTAKLRSANLLASHLLKVPVSIKDALNFTHANYSIVDILPEKKSISIAQIHQVVHSSQQTSFVKDLPKVVIINQADKLGAEASNALLKTLEEPSNTIFVLITNSLDRLLPTIRSRAQTIVFSPLSSNQIEDILVSQFGVENAKVPGIAALSKGRLELTLSYLDPTEKENVAELQKTANEFYQSTLQQKFALAKSVSEKIKPSQLLEELYYQIDDDSDIIKASLYRESVLLAEKQINNNVNSRLVLENLALKLA